MIKLVSDLLNMYSAESLRKGVRNDSAKVIAIYDLKAEDIKDYPVYAQLDEHLRNGTIDPVLISAKNEIIDGLHRIVRAHQIGVTHLPVSYDWESQEHLLEWDDILGIIGTE
jgi:hypothetical protein